MVSLSLWGAWQVLWACATILACMWALARLLDRWDR